MRTDLGFRRRWKFTFYVPYESHEERPLAGHRHTWEDNIKMDLKETECGGVDWNVLIVWHALPNTAMDLPVP
jgi:hypothetical protein